VPEKIATAIFSTLGGAFLGVCLSSFAQGSGDPDVIRVLSERCVATPATMCQKLVQSGAPSSVWLVLALIFLITYFGMMFSHSRKMTAAKEKASKQIRVTSTTS